MATEDDQQQAGGGAGDASAGGSAAGAGAPGDNTEKHPDEWVTGAEPMTGAQASYLQTLSREAGVEFDESLTKADASRRIEELQAQTGRGEQQEGGDAA